jgi:hypothetical protein
MQMLTQLPMLGIFVWFILEWSNRLGKEREQRDKEWREFLQEERNHRAEAIGRLAEEIKTVSKQLSEISGLMQSHDTRANSYIDSRLKDDQK